MRRLADQRALAEPTGKSATHKPQSRAPSPAPIAIDISRCTQLRLSLLCALGDGGIHEGAPDTESPWGAPIEPQPVQRFMVGPVASQHAWTVGRRHGPHVEIDVLSCCVGDGGDVRRDVCAPLSVRAACTNVYDFGARPSVLAALPANRIDPAHLQSH